MEDLAEYEKVKEEAREFYTKIGRIFCPALNQAIHFTRDGFNHIIYQKGAKERDKAAQMSRFRLLPLAVKLVAQASTYQEYEKTVKEFEVKNKKKKRVIKNKPVCYWGLIGIIENRKLKVTIKQEGHNGPLRFWSVVPAWDTYHQGDVHFIGTTKGDPEED